VPIGLVGQSCTHDRPSANSSRVAETKSLVCGDICLRRSPAAVMPAVMSTSYLATCTKEEEELLPCWRSLSLSSCSV
jgi:hypothetical protein